MDFAALLASQGINLPFGGAGAAGAAAAFAAFNPAAPPPPLFKAKKQPPAPGRPPTAPADATGAEHEDIGAVDAAAAAGDDGPPEAQFIQYAPKHVKEGRDHPDAVVETSTLAAMSPPLPSYKHHLQKALEKGTLSNLQIESVIYAFQRFNSPALPDGSRPGFFLGDGAGVGKGRQLAACAYEHLLTGGSRVLWVSVSSDLRIDAARDLDDLGLQQLELYPKRDSTGAIPTGSLKAAGVKRGVLFFTYALLISGGKHGTRLKQVADWLAKDPSPLIIFDECHKCKNFAPGADAKPTKTALCAVTLQNELPRARVIYASATGASTPENLAYMVRLGTFGMDSFSDLLRTLKSAGLGSLELFAMGLKASGAYACRTLSYAGAEFDMKVLPLSPAMRLMYDRSTTFWSLLGRVFLEAETGTGLTPKSKARFKWSQFWGAHQRFFRQMLIAAKVPALAKMSVDAVANKGMAVVIGLQSTGEANTSKAVAEDDGDLDDWVSTPQVVLTQLIESQFPVTVAGNNMHDFRGLYQEVLAVVSMWNKSAAAAAGAGAPVAAAAAAASAEEEDDDDVCVVGEKTLDEVEAEKLERAKLAGDYFDFTRAPSDKELAEAEAAAAAARQLANATQTARREAETRRLQAERAAVRAVARGAAPEAGAAAAPRAASSAEAGAHPLIGRKLIRGSGRTLEQGCVLACVAVGEEADEPCFRVRWQNAGEVQLLNEEELGGLLVPASGDASDSDDFMDDAPIAAKRAPGAAGAAPPPPPAPKRKVASVQVGGRALRAGARDNRPIVIESSDEGGAAASSSSDEGSASESEEAAAKPKAGKAKMALSSDEEEEEEERGAKRAKGPSGVKQEGAAAAAAPSVKQEAPSDACDSDGAHALKDEEMDDEDYEQMLKGEDEEVTDKWLVRIRTALISAVAALDLPPCPLDHLVDLLGGPKCVAEMTGRKNSLSKNAAGKVRMTKRSDEAGVAAKMVNLHERDAFMSGKKHIAIISDAASTGISLQADRRVKNQRRRMHITLELPWSADKAIQQFGRSHRSNQVSAPIYIIVVTEMGGERRFAAAAAKRLLSLGALLHGDRNAMGAGASLKQFDIETRWGSEALKRMFNDVIGYSAPMAGVGIPGGNLLEFQRRVRKAFVSVGLAKWAGPPSAAAIAAGTLQISVKDSEMGNVPRFLNRLLGIAVDEQQDIFAYFSDTFDACVLRAKSSGKWDEGIVSLKAESIKALPGFPRRIHTEAHSGAETKVVKIQLDRGVPFEVAVKRLADYKAEILAAKQTVPPETGWYRSTYVRRAGGTEHPFVVLATEIWTGNVGGRNNNRQRHFRICRPNNGYVTPSALVDLQHNYEPVSEAVAKELWNFWHKHMLTNCVHGANCKTRLSGRTCVAGARKQDEHMIVGAVLPVWRLVTQVCSKAMRVVRTVTDDGEMFVGLHLESADHMARICSAVEAADAAGAMFAEEDAAAAASD